MHVISKLQQAECSRDGRSASPDFTSCLLIQEIYCLTCDAMTFKARNGELEADAEHCSLLGFRKERQDPLLSKRRLESATLGTSFGFRIVFRSLFEEGMVQVRGFPAGRGQLAARPELSFPSANQRRAPPAADCSPAHQLHPKPCTRSWSWVHALLSSFYSTLAIPSQLCLNCHSE